MKKKMLGVALLITAVMCGPKQLLASHDGLVVEDMGRFGLTVPAGACWEAEIPLLWVCREPGIFAKQVDGWVFIKRNDSLWGGTCDATLLDMLEHSNGDQSGDSEVLILVMMVPALIVLIDVIRSATNKRRRVPSRADRLARMLSRQRARGVYTRLTSFFEPV